MLDESRTGLDVDCATGTFVRRNFAANIVIIDSLKQLCQSGED